MDYKQIAAEIVKNVGGQSNIISATHCMTRLRLVLADEDRADDAAVGRINGVLSVIKQGGQYQIVIGNTVPKVYREIIAMGVPAEKSDRSVDGGNSGEKNKKQGFFNRLFGFIAGSMTPLLPAMLGGGMVKVILTLLTTFGAIDESSTTYGILYLIGDAFFYFLPIMLAASVAKRIGSSQMLAMLVAAVLLHPNLTALFGAGKVTFFGIPVTSASYASSVLPIYLIVPLMKYIEIFADKITPDIIKVFAKPLIVVAISAPLALIVIGPIGAIAGQWLADGVNYLYSRAGWLTIMLLSGFMPFIIMTGMHYALIPIATISLASIGFDPILTTTMFCSNLAQGGAAMAVALKSKDKSMKQVALGSGVSAIVAGVTEPALYGVTMKLKTPLLAACISSGIAGLYAGFTKVVAYTLGGSPSVISLVTMIGGGNYRTLINGIITMVIVLVLSFTLTLILFKNSKNTKKAEMSVDNEVVSKEMQNVTSVDETTVCAPVSGKILPLSEVKDVTFASGVLGRGCAIIPSEGKVYAPFDGNVETIFDTGHAVSLTGPGGIELLIHVGRDTVSLGGKYFTAYCKSGDDVKKGDLLIAFETDKISSEGLDCTTPVVVTNSDMYESVGIIADGNIRAGDKILSLKRKK